MAQAENVSPVAKVHGKTKKESPGYYYVDKAGNQFYRDRVEGYQRNQSPRQKWNSLAFGAAHKQIRELWNTDERIAQVTEEWNAAMRIGANNCPYSDPKNWKFAMLQHEWKVEHPFEQWYTEYLAEISATATEKTSSEDVSDYMLRHQAEILEQQAAALRAQLKARHQPQPTPSPTPETTPTT